MYKRDSAFGRIVSFIRQSKTERTVFPWQKYTRQPYPSQEEMARELIVDPSTWRKIERGERRVDRDLAEEVAAVLQPLPTQEVLLFAFADLFEVGLTRYLGMPSTRGPKSFHSLSGQGLSLVGPFERLGHGSVIIVDEGQHFGL